MKKEKSSQEKTQDICDAVAFGIEEGRKQRKQRRQPEQTLEDKYLYMCELSEDMSREIYEQKKIIAGAQKIEKSLKDFVSNMFELNNGEYSLRDIDKALSYWEKTFEKSGIRW